MNFFIVVLGVCLFISLFTIYTFSKDDLTLLRKDVSMDRVFNIVFLTFFFGLLIARIFYAAFYAPRMFLNPLAFFLFPYFPGLSLVGGVLGGLAFLLLYFRKKSLPSGRIMDFLSIGFLSCLPVGFLGFFLLSGFKNYLPLAVALIFLIIFFVFMRFFYQLLQKGIFRDGSLSYMFLAVFSDILLAYIIWENFSNFKFLTMPEAYLTLFLFLASLFMFVKNEKLIKIKRR
jgi:hypothetical protein